MTSSNAVKVVKKLTQNQIYFIPDSHLARFVAKQAPEKEFIYHNGYCPTHRSIERNLLLEAKQKYPNAPVLAHPECAEDVLELADYVGSTTEIIRFAKESPAKEYIIATETGVFYQLEKENPDKRFYPVISPQVCPDMKKVTMEKIANVLENMGSESCPEVILDTQIMERAARPLEKMLEMAR